MTRKVRKIEHRRLTDFMIQQFRRRQMEYQSSHQLARSKGNEVDSNSLFHPDGILEGIMPQGDPVLLDAWGPGMANANRLILGPPGWGKSHYVKTVLMRLALKYRCAQHQNGMECNFQLITIDPEREYGRVALPFHGQMVRLAPSSQHHLNPFDLPHPTRGDEYEYGDRLADHIQRLHTLLEIMLADRTLQGAGKLSSQEEGFEEGMLSSPERLLVRVRSENAVPAAGERGQDHALTDFQPVHATESQNNHVSREVTDAFDPGD